MKLYDIAYSRAGDKGDIANVSVFVEADWPTIRDRLTVEEVRKKFGPLVKGEIVRYEFPNLHGLNFVLYRALDGGCGSGLRLDQYGKAYSSLMLDIDL